MYVSFPLTDFHLDQPQEKHEAIGAVYILAVFSACVDLCSQPCAHIFMYTWECMLTLATVQN